MENANVQRFAGSGTTHVYGNAQDIAETSARVTQPIFFAGAFNDGAHVQFPSLSAFEGVNAFFLQFGAQVMHFFDVSEQLLAYFLL